MKIGGYVMLSISVLSESESIHRKTSIGRRDDHEDGQPEADLAQPGA